MLTMMDGILPTAASKNKKDLNRPRQCHNCDEMNKPENKFCNKCRYVLTYDAKNEIMQDAEKNKREIQELKEEQKHMRLMLGESLLQTQTQLMKRLESFIQEKLAAAAATKNNEKKKGNKMCSKALLL
jgi:hypothetical protein